MMIMIIVFLVVIAVYIILAFCIFKATSIDDCPPCDDCLFSGDKDYCPCNKFLNWKENDE